MATRFRKLRTRRMKHRRALKTRKHVGGNGLLERLGLVKKKPLSSQGVGLSENKLPTSGRLVSESAFIENRKRSELLKQKTKTLRNLLTNMQSKNEEYQTKILNTFNANTKEKLKTMLKYPNVQSLSNEKFLELFKTGKVRSSSA
jgi:hypothetical protein